MTEFVWIDEVHSEVAGVKRSPAAALCRLPNKLLDAVRRLRWLFFLLEVVLRVEDAIFEKSLAQRL